MWDLPGRGLEPVSPELAGGFLTTATPGRSLSLSVNSVFHRCPEMVYVKCLILSLHTEGIQ